uniref:TIR domain-containing protein n=1 Tax=Leptobrachium leishanense TaxID=445787 RepID=A0A8C5MW29_9ANUR
KNPKSHSTFCSLYGEKEKIMKSVYVLPWITYMICAGSFCLGVLRMKCQVLERKYFEPDLFLTFDKCDDFEFLKYTIAVNCDNVDNLNYSLAEVPVDTDWLCLSKYMGRKIGPKSFSRLTNLHSLYIIGNVELLPGSENITFHEDAFKGLSRLRELKLNQMEFAALDSSMFHHLHHLEHLILEYNRIPFLSTVTKSLGKLKTLQKLSILNNDIETLREEDCLHSEQPIINSPFLDFNISVLDLSRNKLQNIMDNSLCNFPYLYFFLMELCAFSSYFNVKELILSNNAVDKIDTNVGSCANVNKIDLSYNSLEKVHSDDVKKLKDLTYLDISFNLIQVLEICPNATSTYFVMNLEQLNAASNSITFLAKGQFSCLENLQILSLEKNRIARIEDFTFHGLKRLQVLRLQNNNIFQITERTFYSLFSLRYLNLYENILTETSQFPSLSFNQLEGIKLTFKIYPDEIDWVQSIGHSLKDITVKTYDTYVSLQSHYLNYLPDLVTIDIESTYVFVDTCQQFDFSRLKKIHLKNNLHFTCFGSNDQALGNFTNLEKLSYNAVSHDSNKRVTLNSSLQYLKELKFLQIENTDKLIGRAQVNVYELFRGLSSLKILHLKNSGIDYLDSDAIFYDLKSLEFLLIENQNIQELNEHAFTSMPNLRYIYLKNIAFDCNCKFSSLLSWLKEDSRVSIVNLHEQLCFGPTMETSMLSFLQEHCQNDTDFKLFICTFIIILVIIGISLFHESLFWYFLYLLYMAKCWLNHRLKGSDKGNFQYDVFVSYNTHDEQWITEMLLPNLEEKGPPLLRVCIHNRDFEIGKDILNNIVDSMDKSRWTICVITRQYLQSSWCSLEMRMATYRLISESKDSLILIFLDRISREELECYHRPTKLLNKKTYLSWPDKLNDQELFWVRLRTVLETG